jgi:signal transduction histidine kinase
MSAEQKHKLFDDTKKGSIKGTAGETGSGLGLMLSKQFIRKNNGSLSVKSEQGKGSVFTVSLPQAGAKKYAPKVTY